jgi:flagellar hook protein FlgE
MMIQGFHTGVSGIKSYQTAIDVTANNLANINTVGFRGNTAEFASLYEKTLSMTHGNMYHNREDMGIGARVNTIAMTQEQGSILLTDKSTDLAIYGDGWFGVQDNKDSNPLYTRAGNFTFDADSNLVLPDGSHVLGTMGTNIKNGITIKQPDGSTEQGAEITEKLASVDLKGVEEQVPLSFPKTLVYPPEPTKTAKMIGNIGVDDEVRTLGAGVIDADGNRNHLRIKFTKAEEQKPPGSQWNATATIQSLDGSEIYTTISGVVEFNADGSLKSNPFTTIDNRGSDVVINLGNRFDGVVSIANSDITSSSMADGIIGGDLRGYEINRNAEVIATFTNGVQTSVGKVAVFHFQNDQGLDRITGTKFRKSSDSGDAMFFQDNDGKNIIGTNIANYQLENANVKMEVGLTDLIIMQRAFDANSKCITTADQMIQKALQMDA